MKILVIGGSRFFGKVLVRDLLEEGHEVTILTRGNTPDGFGNSIDRIICDRFNSTSLESALKDKSFDIVFDQICYDYEQARDLCLLLKGRANKIVFTSSKSVYGPGEEISEEDFNPVDHSFNRGSLVKTEEDYAEAKRQAEVGFIDHWEEDLAIIRPPIILGNDDYTKRLLFHVEKIGKGEEIYFPDLKANISFCTSEFAGRVISKLGLSDFCGPINIADIPKMNLSKLVELIEEITQQKLVIGKDPKVNHSPYGIGSDWFMSCEKLYELGLPKIQRLSESEQVLKVRDILIHLNHTSDD